MFLFILILSLVLLPLIMKTYSSKKNPPGPQGLPFIGNLLQWDASKPHIWLWHLSQKYGPLTYLKHGSTPILVVSSSKMAKQILKSDDLSFCSRPPVVGQQKLSYGGIDMAFSPYNPHWKRMRKICLVHLLSSKQVLSFRPVREDEVSRMMSKIVISSSPPQPVNLSVMAMNLASNLICRVAFGRRYDGDEFEKKKMDRLVMEAQSLMVGFYFSDHLPALGWLDKVLGLSGRLKRNCRELDAFYQQLIDEHLLHPSSRPKPDIIDLMLQLKHQDCSDLTWGHIKALLMDLFIAGTDTVAAAIVWTMTGLMLRPTIMKKAQMQIRQMVGPEKGRVDEDDIRRIPYLKAVVLEVLRLYPPAPLLHRTPVLSHECSLDGYRIRPGTWVIINAWGIGRDPGTWEDPNEFRPERFMGVKAGWDDEFEMIPFGAGRRGCPGMGVGLASVELALANLLYTFDWALPPGVQHVDTHASVGLTMHKKQPLVLLPTRFHFDVQDASNKIDTSI